MPAPLEPANSNHPDPIQDAEEAQHYRRILHDLIDLGRELARHIHKQVTTSPEAGAPARAPLPDLIASFDRVARAVRRTIILARHIAQTPPGTSAGATAGPNRAAARKRIIREVEDAIQRERKDTAAAEALNVELVERLEGPDLDEELAHRPIPEIIKDICRDLGIAQTPGTPPWWKRRTPSDIEALCTRAANPPPELHVIEPAADRPPKQTS